MSEASDRIPGLYDEKAEDWIADRGRGLGGHHKTLDEGAALERFARTLPPGAHILDVGCGSGWPWGATLIEHGFQVTGLDASPRLIAHAAETLPGGEWIVGDMRTFDLGRTFEGLLVWYSLFHLTPGDQRTALGRIVAHAAPEATLMMTMSGPGGVCIGEWRGEPLYHASLGPAEYMDRVSAAGWAPHADGPENPEAIGAAVLIARRALVSAE